ncbi:MAG: DUF4192 domain-containing protein [Pseudonocardia sp.]|nr:DUF4192 domain-containing protein [Pseudonocardia sp.]
MTTDGTGPAPPDDPASHPPADPLAATDRADLDRLDGLSGRSDLAELVGAEATLGTVVRVRGTGDLIVSLPVLIGFHPRDSLLLVGFGGPNGRRVGLTIRVDLPRPDDVGCVCADAVGALATDAPAGAAVVVVHGGVAGAPGPYRTDVAAAVQAMLVEAGIEPQVLVWAAGTGRGDRWACFDLPGQRCGCTGVLPDPSATPAAAAAVRRGAVVLPDRAALRDVLAAGDETTLRRRAGLRAAELDRAGAHAAGGDPGPGRTAEYLELVRRCLDDAARCRLVVDDGTVLGFCAAFDVPAVRDAAVRHCLGPDAPHAEQLWAALSRSMPAPESAGPAALLAVCALLRGDGALAAIAVERALDASPGHQLAEIMAAMLRRMAGPVALRRLLERAYGESQR